MDPEKAQSDRESRHRAYNNAIVDVLDLRDNQRDELKHPDHPPLYCAQGIEKWGEFKRLHALTPAQCDRVSDMVRRMLRVVDFVSEISVSGTGENPDEMLKRRIEVGESWIKKMVEVDASLIKVDWGGAKTCEPVSQLGDNIKGLLTDDLIRLGRFAEPNIEPTSYEMFAGGYELLPTFGIFPFFLLPERRLNWDIFQYGVQKKLGLSCTKQTENRLHGGIHETSRDARDGAVVHQGDGDVTVDMFITLINKINDLNKNKREKPRIEPRIDFLHLGVGHAASSIILGMLRKEKGADYCENFRTNLVDFPSAVHVGNDSDNLKLINFVCQIVKHSENEFILVCDPGNPMYSAYSEYDLRLMPLLNDVSDIPTSGKNLIIVADVNNVLHFRIIGGDGKMVVDTHEENLTTQGRQIKDFRKQLNGGENRDKSLWPPHVLTCAQQGPGHQHCYINRRLHPFFTIGIRSRQPHLDPHAKHPRRNRVLAL